MSRKFDRSIEDVGNIIALEHVNVQIPDQILGTLFYMQGLGLTRDPTLQNGVTNMWVNVGRSQFHLPTGDALVLRGRVGLVLPDLDELVARLESVRELLEDTQFDFVTPNGNDAVDVTCPWGNRFRCHGAGGEFNPMALGMPYVQFDVAPGAADGIDRFYREIIAAPSTMDDVEGAPAARVQVGHHQELVFRESAEPLADYDGHHIQVYISDFSGPYNKLNERGLISEESNQYQYRFVKIVDPESGEELFEVDHEMRSLTHPLRDRPLVNRNPNQDLRHFAAGHEHHHGRGREQTHFFVRRHRFRN